MEELTATANELKTMVERISSGSQVQSNNIQEMVSSVNTLLDGNEKNVLIIDEMRHNLQNLRDTASTLSDKVDEFKIAKTSSRF